MNIDFSFNDVSTFILVFCRMAGMILFNPLLSRRHIPAKVKIILSIGMTILVTPTVLGDAPAIQNDLALVFAMGRELFAGVACGFVFQIFYYLLFYAGDVMDVGFGLSMAKVFDPGTNIQMSQSGNLLQVFFVLYIFATNSHLLLIRIFTSSYMIIPVGAVTFGGEVGRFVAELFVQVCSLVIRLVLPFMAATFTMEIAMGILMKLIPQINVFVINLQSEILLGLTLLLLFSGPLSTFVDNYMNIMFQSIEKVLYALR